MNENENQNRPGPLTVCGECAGTYRDHPLIAGERRCTAAPDQLLGPAFRPATLEDLDRLGIPRPKPGPHLVVDLVTTEHRGDHAADVRVALEVRPWETLADLVARAGLVEYADRLEVRLVRREP